MNVDTSRLLEAVTKYRGSDWLDLGCGDGAVCFWLAERGAHVLGADLTLPLPPGVATAVTDIGPGSVVLVNADVLDLEPGRRFDGVVAFGLLHSLGSPDRVNMVLARIAAWTVPGATAHLSWLLDAVPPTAIHARAYFPAADLVRDALARLGFDNTARWTTRIEHAHRGSPFHHHNVVYSSWRRRS